MCLLKSRIILSLYQFFALFFMLLMLPSSGIGASDSVNVNDVLNARIEMLSNVIINYEETIKRISVNNLDTLGISLQTEMNGLVGHIATGIDVYEKEFSCMDTMSLYKETVLSRKPEIELDYDVAMMNSIIKVYLKDRYEQLIGNSVEIHDPQRYHGTIANKKSLPECDIEIALGMRMPNSNKRLNPESMGEMDITFPTEELVKLTSTNDRGSTDEYVLSKELGYAPISFKAYNSDGQVTQKMDMSEYKYVDGLMLPYKVDKQYYIYKDEKQELGESRSFIIKSYRLNDPENTAGRYQIEWPENTEVYDERVDIMFTALDGKLFNPNVEDVIIDTINDSTEDLNINTQPPLEEERNVQEISKIAEETEEDVTSNDILGQTANHSMRNLITGICIIALLAVGISIIAMQKKRTGNE